MKGVTFGTSHSYSALSLLLASKVIESPKPKTSYAEVAGSDGSIDFTEFFGEVKYSNRSLSFDFLTIVETSEFLNVFSNVQSLLHGKKMKIILDDDPNFYYFGRITVDKWKSNGRIGKFTVDADCDPYKYKLLPTVKTDTITTSGTKTYTNLRKSVVPTFTTTATMTIVFGTVSVTANAGTFQIPEIQFVEGVNTISYTGTGTVTVTYQEGEL